jgi:hypothetical protein
MYTMMIVDMQGKKRSAATAIFRGLNSVDGTRNMDPPKKMGQVEMQNNTAETQKKKSGLIAKLTDKNG